MSRPHVENLDTEVMPRTPWRPGGLPGGLTIRELFPDPETGANTAIIDFPAGWRTQGPLECEADIELYVLDGELRLAGQALKAGFYAYHPAASPLTDWHAARPSSVLAIFNCSPTFRPCSASGRQLHRDAVPALNTWEMPWDDPLSASDPTEDYRAGVMVKVLRVDEATGSSTHLAGLMPGWFMPGTEEHPVSEENFCLHGDVHIGVVGDGPGYTMTKGIYLGRPPGIVHGPIVSKNGNINFCKTHGRLGIKYERHPDAKAIIDRHLTEYPWR